MTTPTFFFLFFCSCIHYTGHPSFPTILPPFPSCPRSVHHKCPSPFTRNPPHRISRPTRFSPVHPTQLPYPILIPLPHSTPIVSPTNPISAPSSNPTPTPRHNPAYHHPLPPPFPPHPAFSFCMTGNPTGSVWLSTILYITSRPTTLCRYTKYSSHPPPAWFEPPSKPVQLNTVPHHSPETSL